MRTSIQTVDLPYLLRRLPFYYGWIILPVASLSMFISGPGQTYSFSIFVDPIMEDTGWSRSTVSGLYTLGSLTASTAMIFVGKLLDRFGARIMLVLVGLLFGFAALWMSTVSSPIELYLGFMAMRLLGQGSLTLIPTTLIALWFIRQRGRVMAITSLGSVISHALFPPMIFLLITNFGWRSAWVVIAFMIWIVLLLPAFALVRRTPESVGLLPDGDSESFEVSANDPNSSVSEVNFSLSEAVRTRSFWLLLFAGTSQSLISTALAFHHVSLITSKGLDASLAATIFTVMAPTALAGNFMAGYLLDKVPNRFVLASAQGIFILAMVWVLFITNAWQAIVYGSLIGLSGGFSMTTTSVIWPNYYGRSHLGSIRGLVTTIMVASAALGPWPFGVLFDLTNSYTTPILVFLGLPVACAVAAIAAVPPRRF